MALPISSPALAVPTDLVFWHLVTRLGEAEILLPAVLLAALWLAFGAGQGRLTLRWLGLLALAGTITTATKVAFIGYELGVPAWDFTGISGHATFATASYPMLLWVLLMHRGPRAQRIGVGFGFAIGLLIAYSRLPTHAHSSSEVVAGVLLGCTVSLLTLKLPRNGPPVPWWLPALTLVGLTVQPVYAPPSHTHDLVTRLSLRVSGHAQPYTRAEMHRRDKLGFDS
ncbi:MAG TPA: phosphatase PAP2 family protein [Burkholderiaceae bacterium]|jgi:membrane-associated phospholipid phosphatase